MSDPIDDDWQIFSQDWWRISFSFVEWTYPPSSKKDGNFRVPPRSSSTCARPPYYHDSLIRNRSLKHLPDLTAHVLHETKDPLQDTLDLSPELPGVMAAEEAISAYEFDVGFYYLDSFHSVPSSRAGLKRQFTSGSVAGSAFDYNKWDELMRDISGSQKRKKDLLLSATPDRSPNFSVFGDDSWSSDSSVSSTFGSMDLSSSFTSGSSISMPPTPTPNTSFASLANATSPSPAGFRDSPSPLSSKRLNAAASTFVPVSTPPLKSETPSSRHHKTKGLTCSTPISNFTFPSLSVPPVPPVKIQKDEQGFYSGIDENEPRLPSFLHDASQKRKGTSSKTRAIVDRLRKPPSDKTGMRQSVSLNPSPEPLLSLGSDPHPRPVSEGGADLEPSVLSTDDGWLNVQMDVTGKDPAATSKDSRTQQLFRALRRHRSDSNSRSPNRTSSDETTDGEGRSSPSLSTPALSFSSTSTVSSPSSSIKSPSTNDGWIESPGNNKSSKTKHRRRQSSNSSSRGQNSGQGRRKNHSVSSIPPIPPFPTNKPPPILPAPGYPYINMSPFIQHPSHPGQMQYVPGGLQQQQPYFYVNYNPTLGGTLHMNPAYPGYVRMPLQYPHGHPFPVNMPVPPPPVPVPVPVQTSGHPASTYASLSRPYAPVI